MEDSLINKAKAGDVDAINTIMQEFKPLVKAKAKAYFLLGGDLEDLIQEGMIGLYKAILDFNESKAVSFPSFASLCVVRQIQTAIKLANRKKHIPLNTSLSLHNEVPPGNLADANNPQTYLDKLPDNQINDPEALFLGMEAYNDIGEIIRQNLSKLEYQVLTLHMEGKSLGEIAEKTGRNKKAIDNTIQRIRKKIRSSINLV